MISLARVQQACAGTWVGPAPAEPTRLLPGVSTDTRSLSPGEVFFALRGPHFDGHAFAGAARKRGAAAAVVARPVEGLEDWPQLRVDDTTRALADLARSVRMSLTLPVVGITGSVGKTTTKEFTAELLAGKGTILRTQGNLNNHIGLPLTLLRLRPDHAAAVVEMGMSAPGEIRVLSRIARPDVAVITNVAPVHLEFFDSLDEIASAKSEILEGLGEDGTVVLNQDDARVRGIGQKWSGRCVWFGMRGDGPPCDVSAHRLREDWSSTQLDLHLGAATHPVRLPLPGLHVVSNFLAAAAVAHVLGISGEEIAARASGLGAASSRGQRLSLQRGITVLDDSYNANPVAVEAAARVLGAASKRRRVAFLGDMLELGPTSPELHRITGERVAPSADLIVGIGPMAAHLLEGAREAGLPAPRLVHFSDAEAAAAAAPDLVQTGDVVLVKGSRGVHTERVVEALRTHFGVED